MVDMTFYVVHDLMLIFFSDLAEAALLEAKKYTKENQTSVDP